MIRSDLYRIIRRRRNLLLIPIYLLIIYNMVEIVFNTNMVSSLQDLNWFTQVGAKTAWPPLLNSMGFVIYQFLVYIIVAIPASDLFIEDKRTNISSIFRLHVKREKQVFSHYFSAFVCGGIAGIFPLLLASYIIFMMLPSIGIHPVNMTNFPADNLLFFDLLFSNFWLFFTLIMIRSFFGCGFIAMFSMAICNRTKNSYLGLILPMIIILALNYIPFINIQYMVNILPATVYRLEPKSWLIILLILLFIGMDMMLQVRDKESI